MVKRNLGDIIEFRGKKYEVVKSPNGTCYDCYFNNKNKKKFCNEVNEGQKCFDVMFGRIYKKYKEDHGKS